MLTIVPEYLPLIRQVLGNYKAELSPVGVTLGRKQGIAANPEYLNALTLDSATQRAETLHRALPAPIDAMRATVYLNAGEFRTLLDLLMVKVWADGAEAGDKCQTLWCQLTLTAIAYEEKYGPLE
jgi:hypothetical protein